MNILVLGPQGSGKGTQVKLLVDKFGFDRVEMGDILRSIANSDNPKAEEIKNYMNRGELVPDEFVRLLVWDHINKHDKERGFIFDGYPRSLAQYEHVSDMLRKFGKKIDRVICLKISEEETIKRLSARRTCEKCGKIWNLITTPPPKPEECECKGKLIQRQDDEPEAIKIRLATFNSKTVKILEMANNEGILEEIDGEQPIEKIHEDIVKVIEEHE